MESEYIRRTGQLIEYIKIHIISLDQDSERIWNAMDQIDDLESDEYESLNIEDIRNGGEQSATRHLLSVAADILGVDLKEK
jgi:hypothetical protein